MKNPTPPWVGTAVPDDGATTAVKVTAVPYVRVAFEVLTVVVVAVPTAPPVTWMSPSAATGLVGEELSCGASANARVGEVPVGPLTISDVPLAARFTTLGP